MASVMRGPDKASDAMITALRQYRHEKLGGMALRAVMVEREMNETREWSGDSFYIVWWQMTAWQMTRASVRKKHVEMRKVSAWSDRI